MIGIVIMGQIASCFYIRVFLLIKQRNAQQAFSKQLIEVAEKERKRIAAFLYHSLDQNMLIIKNKIQQ